MSPRAFVYIGCVARRLSGHDGVRGEAVEVRIADTTVRAFTDESLAAAALASGARVLSRSLKYHRPRTFFCLEGHCSGCLVRLDGVPNLRACLAPCTAGAEVVGQNAFPSAEVDLLGAVDFLFSRGLDHHTLMTSSSVLNKLANKVVRQLSGLGKLPDQPATTLPDVQRFDVDVCVIGGGPSGLEAATACARAGKRTVLVDDQLRPGGSMRTDPRSGRALAEATWQAAVTSGVAVLGRSTAIGFFPEDDGGVLAVSAPERLYRVYAKQWIWATGGYAVNLPFGDNDRPGVIAARAVGRLLVDHGILAGDRIVVVEVPEMMESATVLSGALVAAGADVHRVALDSVISVKGRSWVSGVVTMKHKYECDIVAVAAIPAPASEGARQQGCKVVLDPPRGGFKIVVDELGRTSAPNVWACGDVCGYVGPAAAAADGARVGTNVVGSF
jgi:sarcosine oxidase subunit alpha